MQRRNHQSCPQRPLSRRTSALVAIGAGALLALAAPLAASAHVTVTPGEAEPGSFSLITVKVPNESATESTTRVELTIPEATPFAFLSYVPVPGWTTELVKTTLPEPVETEYGEITEAVTTIIWTAQPGSEITDGQIQLFPLSVGPVPDTGSIVLKADQTYSDGTVVSWSEEGEDAEHPAPVLYVNDAPVGHHDAAEQDRRGLRLADLRGHRRLAAGRARPRARHRRARRGCHRCRVRARVTSQGRPGLIVRRPSIAAFLAALALAGTVVLGTAAPAQAHNFLVSSTPAAGELVTTLPEAISVTTNGPLLDLSGTGAGFAIQVTDAAGTFYGDGCLTVSGASLSTPAALGAAGTYRVVWQVVSEDGHTVSDEFTFEWSPGPGFEPRPARALLRPAAPRRSRIPPRSDDRGRPAHGDTGCSA